VTTCEGSTTIDYVLDGDHLLVETHSNGITLAYTYDVDGSLLSMNYNGTEYFYVTNLQGDVIELLDSQGTRVVSYEYDAWGNILHQTGGVLAELNPYRYRGYRYDSETDYYYLQSRYYDPSIGRFISSDGLVGEVGDLLSHNMYAYGANNPVMNVDPSGEFATAIVVILVIVWTISDAGKIVDGEVYFDSNTGEIKNSYLIQNPIVMLGYSYYLKYYSSDCTYFSGSYEGIFGEWMGHNLWYNSLKSLEFVGITSVLSYDVEFLITSAENSGLGHSIFEETRVGVLAPSLLFMYAASPKSVIIDLFGYLSARNESGEQS
jgi:RHS repeat-associated protein